MAESVFGKPIDNAIQEINDKIGTVPSGETVEGQIDALNSNLIPVNKTIAGGVYLRSIGNMCLLCISGDISAPAGQETTIATLDAGDRPISTMYGVCAIDSGAENKYGLLAVTALGVVKVYNYSGKNASYLYGTIPFIRYQ